MTKAIREFDTGATRDTEEGKLDFEGALSPLVLWAFASYMEGHTVMKDGSRRSSDNWQKGFPQDVLVKSLLRHVMDLWLLHRGQEVVRPEDGKVVDWDDALGGCMFNLQALWHQRLTEKAPTTDANHQPEFPPEAWTDIKVSTGP